MYELMLDTADLASLKRGLAAWPVCGVTCNPSILKKAGKVDLYFRVGSAYKGATLLVKCGETELVRRKKPIMTPGEMEKITVDASKITGDVTLEIVTA